MTVRRFTPSRPIAVEADPASGVPRAFRWRGRRELVLQIAERWELAEGWWRGADDPCGDPTRRRYFRLVARSGLRCVVYHDPGTGDWFLERISD